MRAAMPRLGLTAPHCAPGRRPVRARPRIGFFSAHLYDHTIADLFGGLPGGLDRGRFESWLLLPPGPDDAVRRRLRGAAVQAVDLPDDVFAAQAAIAAAELDALIFLDIGMQPVWDLLAYGRLAPVQAVLWGHPETTGIDTVDHFLSSAAMEPADGAGHYHETLIRLPGTGAAVTQPPAAAPLARAALGLPEDARLYVCPQTLVKLHPDFDAAMAAILRADSAARIVLLEAPFAEMARRIEARFRRTADDVAGRLLFLPPVAKPDFPRLLGACDVMLDPFHYSGGHTTLTAFAAGLPVVTWPGEFMRGRHTYGFYRLMGVEDGIAADHADYVRRAVSIAGDADRRRRLSSAIAETRAVLFDPAAATAALADFLDAALG
jgi:predicted O-linked N-acetylglucosamine transferase (SPINDLY family)